MNIFDVLFICIGLSMDNMAVAAASSCRGKYYPLKTNFKVASVFCLTGIICLLLGWFGGLYLEKYISFWDHWVSFFILLYIGGKMVLSFLKPEETAEFRTYDLTKIKTLVMLALATNIDVFAIGLTLSFYKVSLLLVLAVLTLCVCLFTLLGFTLGKKLGILFGKKAELIGGIILIIIGFKILIQGLLSV
jgi:putative Mn2+ efflux pump MntP